MVPASSYFPGFEGEFPELFTDHDYASGIRHITAPIFACWSDFDTSESGVPRTPPSELTALFEFSDLDIDDQVIYSEIFATMKTAHVRGMVAGRKFRDKQREESKGR